MSKFCTKCGKPLKDGKCSDCDSKKTEDVVEEVIDEVEDTVDEVVEAVSSDQMVEGFKDIVKSIFKNPIKTVKKYSTEENMNLGLVSIAINAVVIGIMIHLLLNNMLKAVGLNLESISQGIAELNQELSAIGISFSADTNFGLKAGIAMLVVSAIIVAAVYLMTKYAFKKEIDYKKVIAAVGVSEVFLTIGALVTIILSFVNTYLALLCLGVFALMFMVLLHIALKESLKLDSDKSIYIITVAMIAPTLALALVIVVLLVVNLFLTGASMALR